VVTPVIASTSIYKSSSDRDGSGGNQRQAKNLREIWEELLNVSIIIQYHTPALLYYLLLYFVFITRMSEREGGCIVFVMLPVYFYY